ncbi:MAG TPA: hypothetical protein VKA76_13725 [Gammaproteobacteria bacterium]|nr:hypothetical protein [Gammaproteobacteria bacterium]
MNSQPSRLEPEEIDSNRLKRLELTMRDALDGLSEMATLCAWSYDGSCMEILSIEAPGHPAPPAPGNRVVPFRKARRTP